MQKKKTKKKLKKIYILNDSHKWMEIKSDREVNHPYFSEYKLQKKRLERLIPLIKLKRNYMVVDYGCGTGLLADLIGKKVDSYVGVDFSKQFINVAKRRHKNSKNAEFHCQDIIKFSKSHIGKYDLAFTMDFSEHLYDDEFIMIYKA